MKINTILATTLLSMLLLQSSCQKIENALEAKDIRYISVHLKANPAVEGLESTEGLKVVFENFTEGLRIEKTLSAGSTQIDSLIPGTYSINISGQVAAQENTKAYFLNGNKTNYTIFNDNEHIDIDVSGTTVGPLAFSELFYAGTNPFYFRNQYYEIINNSDEIVYLDGLYFANLAPLAATTKLPVWPTEDGSDYVYAERVWQFPGNDRDYPLAPGASFTIAHFAANHKLAQYSPTSPIDCSTSEFEFNMDNATFPDQPAVDMQHVFYNGKAAKASSIYLTSVFGGAYVLFDVPKSEKYDPVNNTKLQTRDLSTTSASLYAKIPVRYIMDAVECGDNQNKITAKRVASVLDAGMTYVGATYNSLGVRRKKVGTRANGTPILMDTNNSTEDFERGVKPTFRYYGESIPVWSSAQ